MTKKELEEEYSPYFGTLVLYHFKVVLLAGIESDDEDVYFDLRKGEEQTFASACIGIIPLAGVLPDKEYNRMVKMWNLNNTCTARLNNML